MKVCHIPNADPKLSTASSNAESRQRQAEAFLADSVAMTAAELIEDLGTRHILIDKIERRAEVIARNVLANFEGEAKKMAAEAIRAKVMEQVSKVTVTISIGGGS